MKGKKKKKNKKCRKLNCVIKKEQKKKTRVISLNKLVFRTEKNFVRVATRLVGLIFRGKFFRILRMRDVNKPSVLTLYSFPSTESFIRRFHSRRSLRIVHFLQDDRSIDSVQLI